MTKPRKPMLCAVDGCIKPRAGAYCLEHVRAWHRGGWARRALQSDGARVREAFERGEARPPERLLHLVGA